MRKKIKENSVKKKILISGFSRKARGNIPMCFRLQLPKLEVLSSGFLRFERKIGF